MVLDQNLAKQSGQLIKKKTTEDGDGGLVGPITPKLLGLPIVNGIKYTYGGLKMKLLGSILECFRVD